VFAWAGAALFSLSLAFFLYSYVATFARPATVTRAGAVGLDIALFTVFALHHSVFARERVRAHVTRLVPHGLERSFYVWVASLLFIAVCAAWQPVAGVWWRVEGPRVALLWGLQVFGGWLTLRSAAIIDIWDLAGVRKASPADPAGATEFKAIGPYSWVRHPIYSGWFLLVFACSPMTGTRLLFALVSSAYLLLAIPLEERSLRATTNGAYDRYMGQVKWKLVPGVY
jgi:protein-S-isoprenylcysteine O-methyltransferase Ste14